MSKPAEPAYWEDWARGLGWNAQQIAEAGRVGSLAVDRGLSPSAAMDVLLKRIRDGRDTRIGPSFTTRLLGSFIVSGAAFAVAAFGVAFRLHYGWVSRGAVILGGQVTALMVFVSLFLAVRYLSRRNWLVCLATAVLSVVAVVLLAPIVSATS